MPLSDQPFVIQGGCNCKAIRYKISVPPLLQRQVYPAGGFNVDPAMRMPVVCTDQCNDCRSATGAIIPHWLLSSMDTVSISCADPTSIAADGKLGDAPDRGPWRPATEVFLSPDPDTKSCLSFFASSANRRRSFCRRCGTMLSYNIFPIPDTYPSDWPLMLDILLGTVDREYLDSGALKPQRHMWWSKGVDWIKDFTRAGASDLPIHPESKVDRLA